MWYERPIGANEIQLDAASPLDKTILAAGLGCCAALAAVLLICGWLRTAEIRQHLKDSLRQSAECDMLLEQGGSSAGNDLQRHSAVEVPRTFNMVRDCPLVQMAAQLGNGLACIHAAGCSHGSLAARNCIVAATAARPGTDTELYAHRQRRPSNAHNQFCVKLADSCYAASMAPSVFTESSEHLTWASQWARWAAPECVRPHCAAKPDRRADVWSFGVLLWEVFALGRLPYGHLGNQDALRAVRAGMTPMEPARTPLEVSHLMQRCWELEPAARPDVNMLNHMLLLLLCDATQREKRAGQSDSNR